MLPFEVRDLEFDNPKLSTIPQKLGVKNSKILGIVLLILFFLLEFLKDEINETFIVKLFIISVITGLFVGFSKIEQNKYYSSFWVEGLSILWLILLCNFN